MESSARDRRRHLPRSVRALVVAGTVFGMLVGYFVHRKQATARFPLKPVTHSGTWIKSAGEATHGSCFRRQIQLPATVVNAWVMVSACDGYEVIVNGDPVSRQFLWRPTRPFQNGSSEKGQRLTEHIPALGLNFPREYQWTGHESYRLPVFIDIRPELRKGENVICVQVESRKAPAKLEIDGEVLLATGERIRLDSSTAWCAEPVPPGLSETHWTQPNYDAQSWRQAVNAAGPRGKCFRSFSPQLFSLPFQGQWMKHPHAMASDTVVFTQDWHIDWIATDAWIRLATNRYFDLLVNGIRVSSTAAFAPDLDSGQWVMERQRSLDPMNRPEILDPDEVDSPFVGKAFERPASRDPTVHDFRSMPRLSAELRHGSSRSRSGFAQKAGSVNGRELDAVGNLDNWSVPEGVRPQSHHQDGQIGGFVAYDVTKLVRRGMNRIEIRLARPNAFVARQWTGQLAIDGQATSNAAETASLNQDAWRAFVPGAESTNVTPVHTGHGEELMSGLPRLQYRGAGFSDRHALQQLGQLQLESIGFVLALTAGLLAIGYWGSQHSAQVTADVARMLYCTYVAAAVILVAALLVKCSFAERHEALWFLQPDVWPWMIAMASCLGVAVGILDLLGRIPRSQRTLTKLTIRRLPKTKIWPALILTVLVMATFVRAHRLDFQPLDDDEYASTQAILAIADSGVPEFAVESVWYTRSPLFHYTVGVFAKLFGKNVWSMRIPCVFFGVATCWLTYLFGTRHLRSPWVGMGAMLLLALHPFEIFTSHVIRFYQMQQFMALLTVYFFCFGFVGPQTMRYRYLTVLAFLGTVMCQEASCVMGFSLLLGFLAFAEEKRRAENIKLVVASGCAMAIIALDYVVFQSRCMTRPAGISPNLEATIMPHLWHPYNFLSLFVGYSRLHIAASVFLVLGFPLVCRERQRQTLALYLILGSGIVMTNLLVTHISLRYQYWLIPVWALLACEGLRAFSNWVGAYGVDMRNEPHRHQRLAFAISLILFIACVLSMSPWRIVGSHDVKLLGDSTGAMRFISLHARPDDQVMVTEPHTHAALIETGRVDYDLSVPLLYDFAVVKDGELVDRNGGARVIGNLQKLTKVFEKHDRVWIAVNREKLRNRGKNIRWEYPGARVDLFLRENCELAYTTYLWSVFLWDANSGQFTPFRQNQL